MKTTGFFSRKTIKVSKITCLIDFVNVGFLFGETKLVDDLLTGSFEERVVDEGGDDGVFVGRRGFVFGVKLGDGGRVEEIRGEGRDNIAMGGCHIV